jgi:hypothetical protein
LSSGAKLIAKYIIMGLKDAREKFGGEKQSDDISATLTYLAAVEQLKSTDSETEAVDLVDKHKLQFVPADGRVQQKPQVSMGQNWELFHYQLEGLGSHPSTYMDFFYSHQPLPRAYVFLNQWEKYFVCL